MNILIVDDDRDKRIYIIKFLKELQMGFNIIQKKSIINGLRELKYNNNIDLVILDMSMPKYDITPQDHDGGGFESFGGKEFLTQMSIRGLSFPTVVVTQFEIFGKDNNKRTLNSLDNEFKKSFPKFYLGSIPYNTTLEDWKINLKKIIIRNFYE